MDSPFYGRSYMNLPSRGRPLSHYAPAVREIPVQYVSSEENRPSSTDSVVKIQKVFRGFLVRKSVKKIKEIKNEVEEIEKRISKEATIDLISRDSQERLKLNEMLMSLLFRLDSVRGVDSGVRDCRKAVIKKAIALQELLDAVVSSNNNKEVQNCENVVEAVDDLNQTAAAVENQNDDGESQEVVEDCDLMPAVSDGPEENVATSLIEACEGDEITSPKPEKKAIESREAEEVEEKVKESGGEGTTGEENTKNREMLERMMEDNERMMELMAQLFERNEMQTRLLSSLSHRVEQLERAFICERLRKKKKKRNAAAGAGTVDCCETSPDNKKCGKR